jgi:two-component system cell cycle sensor histidine kinase/response regulator CckA
MTTAPLRVLIVEDSPPDAELMVHALRQTGREVVHERVDDAASLRAALTRGPWDVVLSDYSLPQFDAPRALAVVREEPDPPPFIVVSGSVGEDLAVAAMQAGATDYIMKDRLQRLAPAVTRAVEATAERRERRQLEHRLQQSQRMEAVGRLAAGVAHDFNNVLTVVLGSTELILLDLPAESPLRDEVEVVQEAATRAIDLIRQLLAFGARQVLQPRVLDLNELVNTVSRMLRRLISEDVQLVIRLAPDLGRVRVDPGQIEQVLVNLAVNARDAMPKGGRLTIETANVTVAAEPGSAPGPRVLLQVSDTGTGMDAETQARIFEPFFTTKARGKGTGLGLATVYGIVRQSGGHIGVDSTPGRGTVFRIHLPCESDPIEGDAAPRPTAPPQGGSETVLLVEDESLLRVLARKVLERGGYHVLAAGGGAEALDLAAQHAEPIHLLLTDVVMPDMSGRDVMQRLAPGRPEMKVLYMSGYADEAVARHGVLDPGTSFIQKPFKPDALAQKVREVLDGPPRAP